MKSLILSFAIILTSLDIFAIAGDGAYIAYLYYQGVPWTNENMMLAIGGLVILIILYPILNVIRRRSRVNAKYDQYGRMKPSRSYEKLSVKEQRAVDMQRMMQDEKILPMSKIKEMTQKGSTNPEIDLASLTGLAEVKQEVAEMAARMEFDSKRNRKADASSHHMCLTGSPGTGKTTVASVLTAYLYKYKVIKNNRLVVTSGAYIAGAGVQAAERIQAIIQNAYGGVLFIDEAYAITSSTYGDEAVAALIQEMEVHRDKFVLILAGYENEMKMLMARNPGFTSRISKILHFPSFTREELFGIFQSMMKKEGFELDVNVREAFMDLIDQPRRHPLFGNARTVREIVSQTISRHAYNLKHCNQGHKRKKTIIMPDDLAYKNPWMG